MQIHVKRHQIHLRTSLYFKRRTWKGDEAHRCPSAFPKKGRNSSWVQPTEKPTFQALRPVGAKRKSAPEINKRSPITGQLA